MTAYLLQTYGSFGAAQSIHDNVVYAVLRAPMAFFDKTPIGRILNRLSSDIERVDTGIGHLYGFMFILVAEVVQCLLAIFIAIPYLMIVISPLLVIFVFSVVSHLIRLINHVLTKCWFRGSSTKHQFNLEGSHRIQCQLWFQQFRMPLMEQVQFEYLDV